MENLIRKIIKQLFPELDAGLHLPKFAQVVQVAKPPTEGDVSTDFEPYYAVDIQLLTDKGQVDNKQPIFEAVPLPVPAGSDEQGLFGFPLPGTWVIVEFAYGSPEHPVIVGILPHRRSLPSVPIGELLWQLSKSTFLRATGDETWKLTAKKDIELKAVKTVIGNGEINLLAEVRRLAEILENHTHSGVIPGGGNTKKPVESAAIASVKDNVNEITK